LPDLNPVLISVASPQGSARLDSNMSARTPNAACLQFLERLRRGRSISLICALAFIACSTGSKSPSDRHSATETGGFAGTGGTGSAEETGGATAIIDAGGSTNQDAGTSSTCPPLPDLGVRFVGRFDACDPKGVRYAWSGSGFVGRFQGTGISVRLSDFPNQHTVLIDGALTPTLKTTTGEKLYVLASGLADGEHTVEMYRRTEVTYSKTVVMGFEVEGSDAGDGQLLAPPEPHDRRIEVVGDSISCGYGIDYQTSPCPASADNENHYLTYGAVLARSLGAELSTVACSGKGIYFNYNGSRIEPMPTIYDRVATDDNVHLWGFAWQPHAVVINLGTNDYSTSHDPTDEQFQTSYLDFLAHIRLKYPQAHILCTVGPMLSGSDLTTARKNIAAVVATRQAAGDNNVKAYEMATPNPSPGCDSHPSIAKQAAMAGELEQELRATLGW
jgi:hypothetical protein